MNIPRGKLILSVCYTGMSWMSLVLGICLLLIACDNRQQTPIAEVPAQQQFQFQGTWSATGKRQIIPLMQDHQAATFHYTGSLLLSGTNRPNRGFRSEVLGFYDTLRGLRGDCIWTDENGDKVFSELYSDKTSLESMIYGRIIGGTGRYSGVTGEYSFHWQRLIETDSGEVSGRVVDLRGTARIGQDSVKSGRQGEGQ